MAIVRISVVGLDDGALRNVQLHNVDTMTFAKFLDSKSKLVNGSWTLKYPHLKSWSMVDDKYHFVFRSRDWMNSFVNNAREFCEMEAAV
jgi:hypothetical protein